MKNTLLILIGILTFYSCKKEEITTVRLKGVITNDATGLPMKNVAVWIVMTDYHEERTYSDSSVTNSLGEYDLDIEGFGIDFIDVYVNKPGFVYYTFVPEKNSDIIKNIVMYPFDSYIKFKVINKLGIDNAIFGSWWSEIYPHQFLSATHTYIIAEKGDIYTETRKCPGNMNFFIAWDYSIYDSNSKFPNLDTVFVNRGDTTTYTIQF